MGIDRWEQEHRNYRPGRPVAEVAPEDRALDVPEDLPVAPEPKNTIKNATKNTAKNPTKDPTAKGATAKSAAAAKSPSRRKPT